MYQRRVEPTQQLPGRKPCPPQRPTPADPVTEMGFPANDHNVIAVSSTDDQLVPILERTEGKVGDLFWHMPGGTPGTPLVTHNGIGGYGSSLATAIFTGILARLLLHDPDARTGSAAREHARLADRHTRPWSKVDLNGHAAPSSRGLLEAPG